jgi:ParB family chromosome partitioning protein
VRRRLEEGELSAGHARALLAAADPAALAMEVVRRGLNVRATEQLVQRRAGAPRKPRTRAADTTGLERELSLALGLRVTIAPKKRGGSLTLHYASLDQLDRVLNLLRGDPPRSARRAGLV